MEPQTEQRPSLGEIAEEAGRVRYEKAMARIQTLKKIGFRVLGSPEAGTEATKRGWEAILNKANEIKTSVNERIDTAKEAAREQRDKAVNAFLEKVNPVREFASQKRDQIVDKANVIGSAAARKVAAGAEAVTSAFGFGVGLAVTGAGAVEAGFRWTLAEAQAKPKELKGKIHEGIAGVARETAKSLRRIETTQSAKAESQRTGASAIRARYGITTS